MAIYGDSGEALPVLLPDPDDEAGAAAANGTRPGAQAAFHRLFPGYAAQAAAPDSPVVTTGITSNTVTDRASHRRGTQERPAGKSRLREGRLRLRPRRSFGVWKESECAAGAGRPVPNHVVFRPGSH